MSEEHVYSRDLYVDHVVTLPRGWEAAKPEEEGSNRILRGGGVRFDPGKVRRIGGETAAIDESGDPPVISVERHNDRIVKIMVRCGCGRHAELLCEYDDEEEE